MGLWDALEDLAEKGIDAAAEWVDEEVGADGVISDFVAEHREEIVDGAAAIATSDDPLATAEDKLDGAYEVVEAEVVDEVKEQAAEYVGEDIMNLAGDIIPVEDPNTTDPANDPLGISLEDILSPEEIENYQLDEDELIDLIDHGIAGRLHEPQELVEDELIDLIDYGIDDGESEPVDWIDPGEVYEPEPTIDGGDLYKHEPEPAIDTATVEPASSDFEAAISEAESVDVSVGAMFEEL